MNRRRFLELLGVGAAWPALAQAQREKLPTVGFLNSGSPEGYVDLVAAFRAGLFETGHVEGRNFAFEFRWANTRDDELPRLARELVHWPAAVIAGVNSTAGARAAKAASSTVPIVFAIGADPVKVGLVSSFSRPGGNMTGISFLANSLLPKRLALLR